MTCPWYDHELLGPVKKHDANQKAFDKFEKNVKPPSKVDVHDISQRTECKFDRMFN